MYGLGFPLLTGGIPLREGTNLLAAYGLMLAICIVPFLLSWVSARLAKKAWRLMKSDGVLYEDARV